MLSKQMPCQQFMAEGVRKKYPEAGGHMRCKMNLLFWKEQHFKKAVSCNKGVKPLSKRDKENESSSVKTARTIDEHGSK